MIQSGGKLPVQIPHCLDETAGDLAADAASCDGGNFHGTMLQQQIIDGVFTDFIFDNA